MYKHLPRKPKVGDVVKVVDKFVTVDDYASIPVRWLGKKFEIVQIDDNDSRHKYYFNDPEEGENYLLLPEIKEIVNVILDDELFEI